MSKTPNQPASPRTGAWAQIRAVVGPDGQPRPVPRITATKLRRRGMLVVAVLGLAALTGPIGALASLSHKDQVYDQFAAVPQARGLAEIAARQFLAGQALTVPIVSDLSPSSGIIAGSTKPVALNPLFAWDGFKRSNYGDPAKPVETEYFLIQVPGVDATGAAVMQQYRLSVPVLLMPQPVLAALPALSPVLGLANKPRGDYSSTDETKAVMASSFQSLLNDWAKAYASNDPAALYNIVAPGNSGFAYRGLGGFTASKATVLSAITTASGNGIVRARVSLTRANGDPTQGSFSTATDFDLLVTNPGSSPRIVAWGPAGSAQELKPFTSNAVTTSH